MSADDPARGTTATETIARIRSELIVALEAGKLAFEHAELAKGSPDVTTMRQHLRLADSFLAKARAALDGLASVVVAFPGKKEDQAALQVGLEKAKEKLEQIEIGVASQRLTIDARSKGSA